MIRAICRKCKEPMQPIWVDGYSNVMLKGICNNNHKGIPQHIREPDTSEGG